MATQSHDPIGRRVSISIHFDLSPPRTPAPCIGRSHQDAAIRRPLSVSALGRVRGDRRSGRSRGPAWRSGRTAGGRTAGRSRGPARRAGSTAAGRTAGWPVLPMLITTVQTRRRGCRSRSGRRVDSSALHGPQHLLEDGGGRLLSVEWFGSSYICRRREVFSFDVLFLVL